MVIFDTFIRKQVLLGQWLNFKLFGITYLVGKIKFKLVWAVLSDEQMSKRWPFSLLNNEQMSNWLGVEHQPVVFSGSIG